MDSEMLKLQQKLALMALESKAATLRQQIGDAELDAQTKKWQAQWRSELRDIRERHAYERKARARGERVPNLHSDPNAYVSWLQRQRALPYIELARDLTEQSRRGLR